MCLFTCKTGNRDRKMYLNGCYICFCVFWDAVQPWFAEDGLQMGADCGVGRFRQSSELV